MVPCQNTQLGSSVDSVMLWTVDRSGASTHRQSQPECNFAYSARPSQTMHKIIPLVLREGGSFEQSVIRHPRSGKEQPGEDMPYSSFVDTFKAEPV